MMGEMETEDTYRHTDAHTHTNAYWRYFLSIWWKREFNESATWNTYPIPTELNERKILLCMTCFTYYTLFVVKYLCHFKFSISCTLHCAKLEVGGSEQEEILYWERKEEKTNTMNGNGNAQHNGNSIESAFSWITFILLRFNVRTLTLL